MAGQSKPDFENLQIPVPQIGEQRIIANALDAGAAEVALLEEKIGRFQTQKRGLMQKLLSGERPLDERFDAPSCTPQPAVVGNAL